MGLNSLRILFPGSAGIILSQIWSFLDGTNSRSVNEFIELLAEHSLHLVGIPFAVLDKKVEKKLLTIRREGIIHQLETSCDGEEVAVFATILICQQIKNLAISGTDSSVHSALSLFEGDKKIPSSVTLALQKMKAGNNSFIDVVKRFGIAKNTKALISVSNGDNTAK